MDIRTDRKAHDNSMYRASIASRVKNRSVFGEVTALRGKNIQASLTHNGNKFAKDLHKLRLSFCV